MNKTKLMCYPMVVTIIGSFLLLIMVLLPFASATEEYGERLRMYEDEMYMEEIGMTNAEAVDVSLFEFVRLYAEAARQAMNEEICIACIVIISIFAGFSALTLLMSFCKKPIGIILFDLLALIAFRITCFDFEDRGVIPSNSYDWGMVKEIVYVIGLIVLVGAIWLLIEKRKAKKIARVGQTVAIQE